MYGPEGRVPGLWPLRLNGQNELPCSFGDGGLGGRTLSDRRDEMAERR